MKGQMLCFPCTVRTAYDIALKATNDEELQRKIILETMDWLIKNPHLEEFTPSMLHTRVQRLAEGITGNPDPFKDLKQVSNKISIKVLPVLIEECKKKSFYERFRLAVLGTICGNTIDFEVEGHQFNMEELEQSLIHCLKGDFFVDDTTQLMEALSRSQKVLYLLDNAGEIVFDRFLIKVITEHYPVKVIAVVKDGPILNDATMEDAEQINLEEVAHVITTGNDHIGICLEESSKEFLDFLHQADLVIAKGQGNYESITEIENQMPKPIFYVLKAKCVLVADRLNAPLHSNIVKMEA